MEQIPLLYQYKSFLNKDEANRERLRELFVRKKLFFSSPSNFNDPFDCWISPLPSTDIFMKSLIQESNVNPMLAEMIVKSPDTINHFIQKIRPQSSFRQLSMN